MIPWQQLVLNLSASGLSRTTIAKRVDSTPATIQHIARGEIADPRWSTGYKLLALHHKHCRDIHERDIYGRA